MSNALVGNTFGIPEDDTVEAAIQRRLATIPMALQVLAESQRTIARLRAIPGVSDRERIEAAERRALGMKP